ncbi:MAG TPA: M12 family metallo-peptidase [Thermoanaerobaculia bacterium]|nr:M12 family metallo-peptidase [Thermoanaerobaculia bacterium]
MRLSLKWIFVSSVLAVAAGPVRAEGPRVLQSRDFAASAAGMAAGARLRLEGVQVADTGEAAAFDLERFEVFAKGAKITIHGDQGDRVLPAPANAYFRGTLKDKPDSRVFLARLADGGTQGMVSEPGGEIYLIGGDPAASGEAKALGGPLMMRRVDPVLLKASRGSDVTTCGNASLPEGPGNQMLDFGAAASPLTALAEKDTASATTALYTARLAIETDYEFFQIFNDATAATNYVANLVGFASTVYAAELNTTLAVQSLSLWQTSNDPWTQRNTLCSLLELGKYWNQNKTGVSRTIVHFLSGKLSGGGLSWVGALCRGTFTTGYAASCPELGAETTPWGGGYGYTGNVYGEFNINNPVVVWDIYAFAHELGHGFGSKHSHCYNNIGGSPDPIDKCYSGESGCYSGPISLPGPAKGGSGTIMSYCHQLSGNFANISMTFGTNFGYGTLPGREAAQMNSYIGAVAAANSTCLAPVSGGGGGTGGGGGGSTPPPPSALPFSDGFESGTMGSWH